MSQAPSTNREEAVELEMEEIRSEMLAFEGRMAEQLEAAHPTFAQSARNLAHYLALRRHDVRDLQRTLAELGLSSLGRSESHVLANLDSVLDLLKRLDGRPPRTPDSSKASLSLGEGRALLDRHTRALFGDMPRGRRVHIMVTLPTEAGADGELCRALVEAGMDCARINCAHDDSDTWARMAENVRRAESLVGRPCRVHMDLAGPKLRTGPVDETLHLTTGDRLVLTRSADPGRDARRDEHGHTVEPARISCALPEVFDRARAGERIYFDDGKIAGVIREVNEEGLAVEVTRTRAKGRKLVGDKGINMPDTDFRLPALTAKDLEDLAAVVRLADIAGLSFVHDPSDVIEFDRRVRELGGVGLGLVLKVETVRAFEQLPKLLFAAMRASRRGVMIARGDLAVECGFERLAEVQEEILWLCEAAHLPVIWATQVLESLAKDGAPSRAEITDAAMSNRAECVMLNKGPHVVEAVKLLDDILRRMAAHQRKKSAVLRPLSFAFNG